jgi:hypothetical protein
LNIAMLRIVLSGLLAFLACSSTAVASDALIEGPCPSELADAAVCFRGRDVQGSFLLAAVPKIWNKRLVVHAHGGPRMTAPNADELDDDLKRFGVLVRAGYAWIGPSYRRADYGVRRAAADVESARAAFFQRFGAPEKTYLHGHSWGAQIALKVLEIYGVTVDGEIVYDAALLTNGIVAGGAQAYQFRVDLRAIYQFYCRNLPRPNETAYPLWMGLAPGATLARADLEERVQECTGLGLPAGMRTADQTANLADILAASGVTEASLLQHMNWATSTLRTLIDGVGGSNPFENRTTAYSGVRASAVLNLGVERFSADPQALALLDYDSKPTGQVVAPVLSIFAHGDEQVPPRLQSDLAATFRSKGRHALLAQIGLKWRNHSRLPDDVLLAAMGAIEDWTTRRVRPNASALRAQCVVRALPCDSLPLAQSRSGDAIRQ